MNSKSVADILCIMEMYELTLVLPSKAKSKEKTFKEKIEKLISELKGKVEKAESWGEIELAYKIAKETSGNFLHFNLELDKSIVKDLSEKLRVDDAVIRYLLVRKDSK